MLRARILQQAGIIDTPLFGKNRDAFSVGIVEAARTCREGGGAHGGTHPTVLRQPASPAEVVGVVVRDQNPPERRCQAITLKQRLPGVTDGRQTEAGIHQPPTPVTARHQPHVDVVQITGNRQADPLQTAFEFDDFPLRRRQRGEPFHAGRCGPLRR